MHSRSITPGKATFNIKEDVLNIRIMVMEDEGVNFIREHFRKQCPKLLCKFLNTHSSYSVIIVLGFLYARIGKDIF